MRKHNRVIIKRTICLVFNLSTALHRFNLAHRSQTNKAWGNIESVISKPTQMRQGLDPRYF